MNRIPHLFRRCYLHIFDTKEELDHTLIDICKDIAVDGKICTIVFASEFSDIDFIDMFLDHVEGMNLEQLAKASLGFANVNSWTFEQISDNIKACAASGCKMVILVGDCVRSVNRYDALAEELGISMLAMDINHNK